MLANADYRRTHSRMDAEARDALAWCLVVIA